MRLLFFLMNEFLIFLMYVCPEVFLSSSHLDLNQRRRGYEHPGSVFNAYLRGEACNYEWQHDRNALSAAEEAQSGTTMSKMSLKESVSFGVYCIFSFLDMPIFPLLSRIETFLIAIFDFLGL